MRQARIRGVMPIVLAAALHFVTAGGGETSSTVWTVTEAQRAQKNPVPATGESTSRGAEVYTKNCLACHGATGDGKGPVAVRLGFSAGDLTRAAWMAKKTDGELFWKIATGRDPMPAFRREKGLTDLQMWDAVNYIRTLAVK